jgi:diguanylate cyclase (GGDEF)-like protein/PAS domain S-box-containing protein
VKDLTQNKVTGINSLGLKFSALVFMAVLLTGLSITYFFTSYQQQSLQRQQQQSIARTAENYQKQFERYLLSLELKALRAQQILLRQLAVHPISTLPASELVPVNDGSWRQRDEWSGVFSPGGRPASSAAPTLNASALAWQQMMPLLQQDFSSVFFMAAEQFIRVAPADWVLHVDKQLPVTTNPLYQLAAPEQNPERTLRWSPIYYDQVLESWVVAVLLPVYQQNEFLGVLGLTVNLAELTVNRANIGHWSPLNRSLLLDEYGQALQPSVKGSQPAMYALYQGEPIADPQLAAVAAALPGGSDSLASLAPAYLLTSIQIPKLQWTLLLYQDRTQLMASQYEFRFRAMLMSVAIAFLLTLLLYGLMHQILLRRLKRLAQAVERLGQGQLPELFLDNKADELGMLNRAFQRMSREIRNLVQGLNARIAEKEQAELQARKLSKAVAFSSSGIAITNQHLEIEYINPFLAEMLEQPAASIHGSSLLKLFANDMQQLSTDISKTLEQRQHWHGDVLLQHSRQAEQGQWVSLAIAPIRDDKGMLTHYVASLQDISFIKQSQKQMEQLAYYDELTGLANRSYFRDQLRKAILMSQRGFSFALLYFDLDEFKLINDTLGHDAGDELLLEVAKRLKARLRDDDLIARLGGDEFAVILSGIKDKVHAGTIAAQLQQAFLIPVKLGQQEVAISASIGITVAPEDGVDAELLLKHADLAMYEAKARGKNTYRFFSQDLNDAANERLLIESQLREAIREQQFVLYYQPKIDLSDETLIGYEALIRWRRPDNTLVPPHHFIHVAESTGLIVPIGEWIILEACRFLVRQHSRGYAVSVSINLSVRQFNDEQLTATIDRIIQRTGVDPAYLVFEITESMLMGDTDAAIKQLNQLKRLGISLSIDDFGTGYSSLNYLKRFPVDELKIDRSFVKDIPEGQNDMDIVAAIIAMAQKMQLRVVAEGVESEAQAEFLKQNACYLVQGYYFSMPLAEQELSYLNFSIKTQG